MSTQTLSETTPEPQNVHEVRAAYLESAKLPHQTLRPNLDDESDLRDRIDNLVDKGLARLADPAEIEIDKSSRRARFGLLSAKLLRAAGALTFIYGLSQSVDGVQDLRHQRAAVIETIDEELDTGTLDSAMSNLITGTSPATVEADMAFVTENVESLEKLGRENAAEAQKTSERVAQGAQAMAVGTPLAVAGTLATRRVKRKRRQNNTTVKVRSDEVDFRDVFANNEISRLDPEDSSDIVLLRQKRIFEDTIGKFVGRVAPHYSRIYALGLGTMLLAGTQGSEFATKADAYAERLYPEAAVSTVVERASGQAVELADEQIKQDIRAIADEKLPRTMEALQANPELQEQYDMLLEKNITIGSERFDDSPQAPEFSFFSQTRTKLKGNSDMLFVQTPIGYPLMLLALSLALKTRRSVEYGTAQAKVSENFLKEHLSSKL